MTTYFASLHRSGDLAAILSRYYDRSEDAEFAEAPTFMRHFQDRLPLYKRWFEEARNRAVRIGGCSRNRLSGVQMESERRVIVGSAGAHAIDVAIGECGPGGNPSDARQSIFGGARYFRQVYEKIPSHVPDPDRTWFALAAYNIGYGHLEDARVLTQRAGKDPDSWEDVREFLPLLAQEYWYTQTSNGYARGRNRCVTWTTSAITSTCSNGRQRRRLRPLGSARARLSGGRGAGGGVRRPRSSRAEPPDASRRIAARSPGIPRRRRLRKHPVDD